MSVTLEASETRPPADPYGGALSDRRSVRFVDRIARHLGRRESRRSFLVKTAIVGSVLAVNPL
ncbi:MAG TPA: hypothetical protein VHS03_02880, partial [Gaiellaceae bacterium]|nr:hypothetical protein [Gaiellaceae bacterium]